MRMEMNLIKRELDRKIEQLAERTESTGAQTIEEEGEDNSPMEKDGMTDVRFTFG